MVGDRDHEVTAPTCKGSEQTNDLADSATRELRVLDRDEARTLDHDLNALFDFANS